MLYMVHMEVRIPHDADRIHIERLKMEEKTRAEALQREGTWVHLWRVAGRYANYSVFDVDGHDRLHEILSTLPLFPFMEMIVTPLARHPLAVES